ncbi:secretin N-terminal domain-containing protein [Kiritimatiellota bacterium B12222]|nr:secretin N-terminal domain-containing protein [Kiritimatiellota bacterium B12222]
MKTWLLCLLLPFQLLLAQPVLDDTPYVSFNFKQVELENLVGVVSMQTGKRFVIDSNVTGRVSVITQDKIRQDEVFPLFVAVLEGSGFTVVDRDGTYHIRKLLGEDPLESPVIGPEEDLTGVGLVTRVIKLEYIRATDLRPLLEPMVRQAKQGSLSAFAPTNHLIITDTASNLKRVEDLIAELDRPGQSTNLTVIPLKYASPRELADQITQAMNGAESAGQQISRSAQKVISGAGNEPADFTLVAAEQANSLIASAGPLQLKQIQMMVEQLDVPADSVASGRLRAVFLNYMEAEAAASQLTALLDKRVDIDPRDSIAVEADIVNNAILVDAGPMAFASVKELLEQIDRPQQQVMVEVMIVEVTKLDSLDLGVEWTAIDQPSNGSTTVVGRSNPSDVSTIDQLLSDNVFPQGLTFGLARGTITLPDGTEVARLPFLLRALEGQQDVNILSHVPLRTQNNAEASVSVVNNIPYLASTIEGGTGANRDVVQNIDRMDVGIKLKIKPQVNPNREITLQLNPSIEAIITESTGGVALTPTIARREVESILTMPDRSTVVISGLMREDIYKEENRVPILGSLPLIGFFFRSTSDRKEKTNLLIFVTPYIVTDEKENDAMTDKWRKQTGIESPESDPRNLP